MESQDISSIRILYYRIYGTNSFFTKDTTSPKNPCSLNPLIIPNYPENGWKLSCFFGEIPKEITDLHRDVNGFGLFCTRRLANALDSKKTIQEQLDECISDELMRLPIFSQNKWHIVEIIEKDIDPQEVGRIKEEIEKFQKESDYQKKVTLFDKNFLYPTAKEILFCGDLLPYLDHEKMKMDITELFNKITLSLMTEIPPYFFTNAISERSAIIINNSFVIGKPSFNSSFEIEVTKNYITLDEKKLIELVEKNRDAHNWLNNVSHWYLLMLGEKDKWKQFYFGFISLEIFTHKMYRKILSTNQFDIRLKKESGYDELIKVPFSDVISEDTNRVTLASKFSIIAGMLNPKKYSEDLLIFKKCKDTRDKMSHGEIIAEEELPLAGLGNLLNYYIQKVVREY